MSPRMTLRRQLHRGTPAAQCISTTVGPGMAFPSSLAGPIAQAIREQYFLEVQYEAVKKINLLPSP